MLPKMFTTLAAGLVLAAGASSSYAAMVGTRLPQTATVNLWMVGLDPNFLSPGGNLGVEAVFGNIPTSTPDLTFGTNLIQYESVGKPNTIQGLFVPGSVINPHFSGLVNSHVGAIVDPNTDLVSQVGGAGGWATIIEITGLLALQNGGHIKIEHDDGVSLKLNNVLTGCFADAAYPGATLNGQPYQGGGHWVPGIQSCTYNGPSGLVPFDLVYAEGFSGPAGLSLAVPEPASLALVSLGLAGLAVRIRSRRRPY